MKLRWLMLTFAALIILNSIFTLAQTDNILEPILEPLASLKIGENYDKYPFVVNFFIYLILFTGIAKTLLKERIGNPAAVGLGIALSISLSWWEFQSGVLMREFLGMMGLGILLVTVGVFFFLIVKNLGGKGTSSINAGCMAYIVVYLFMMTAGHEIFELMVGKSTAIFSLISIAFAACLIRMGMVGFNLFNGIGGGSGGSGGGGGGFLGNMFKTPEEREQNRIKKTEKKAKKIDDQIEKYGEDIEELHNNLDGELRLESDNLIEIMEKILAVMEKISKMIDFMHTHFTSDHDKAKQVYNTQYHPAIDFIYKTLTDVVKTLKIDIGKIHNLKTTNNTIDDHWRSINELKKTTTARKTISGAITDMKDKITQYKATAFRSTAANHYEGIVSDLERRYMELFNKGNDAKNRITDHGTKKTKDVILSYTTSLKAAIDEFKAFETFFQRYKDPAPSSSFNVKLISARQLQGIITRLKKTINSFKSIQSNIPSTDKNEYINLTEYMRIQKTIDQHIFPEIDAKYTEVIADLPLPPRA